MSTPDAGWPPLVARVLAAAGYDAEPSTDFHLAKERLRQRHTDLLVTEVRLDAYNGLHLAIVAATAVPAIPVIVIADAEDAALRGDAERIGASYLVITPSEDDLIATVERSIGLPQLPPHHRRIVER